MANVDPLSPEAMLQNFRGEDSGLSAIKEKPVDDRNLLERAQDYIVSGRFDEDARYALGPHLSKGLSGLAQLFGPGADIKAMVDESKRIVPLLKEGNIPGAVTSLGLAAIAPLLIGAPTDVGKLRKGTEEVTKQVKRYIDEPVDYKFTTGRGSTYEAFPSGKTQRDKAPGHRDGGVGLQIESEKTIFTDGSEQGRRTASDIVGISKSETPTQILPILSESNEVVGIKLVHASDVGPKKVGDTILQMPVSTKPAVGKQPIEIFNKGTDVHVGSPITKIKKGVKKAAQSGNKPYTQSDIGSRKKPVSEMKKNDSLVVPHLDDASKKLIQDDMGMGMHQLTTPVQEFTLVGSMVGNTGADGIGKVFYGVVDKDKNIIGRVVLRRKIGSTTSDDIDGLINIEIDKPYRKKGYAEKILESLRASTDGKPLTIYDIENPKFFKNYGKKINKSRGGSVIERNPYNYSPRSI